MKDNITCTITHSIGAISEKANGYSKELNLVSWNDAQPKYDLRTWHSDHEKSGKGLTMSKEELIALYKLIKAELEG